MSEHDAPEWQAPTDEQLRRALVLVGHSERARLFYQQLENPRWLAPLNRHKVFDEAPAPVPVEEYLQYPRWLEGDYLVRMAAVVPGEVAEVLLKLKDNGNPWAHRQVIAASVAMPAEHAARLVDRIAAFVAVDRTTMLDPKALVELLEHLATLENARALGKMANALYGPIPPSAEEGPSSLPIRPVAAGLDDYWYGTTLPRAWVVLKERLGLNAIRTLVRWLRDWQRMAGYADDNEHDMSHLWCQSVAAASGGPTATPIGDALVRLLAKEVVDSWRAGAPLDELEAILEHGRQPVFLRISMHLLAVAIGERDDEGATATARELLVSERAFDTAVRHEFAALARAVLGRADAAFVERWTEALLAYPSIDEAKLRENLARGERTPEEVSDEELTRTRRGARRLILTAIGDPLPPSIARLLAEFDKEFGEHGPEADEVPFRLTSGFTGPISPLPFDELASLSASEVIAFLRSWEPSEPLAWPPPPTPEGLGRALTQLAATDPTGFAAVLDGATDLDPTYLRGLLDGFETALRNGNAFPWPPVLRLVNFVATQPDEGEDVTAHFMQHDVGWRWSHSQAARLLRTGLEKHLPLGPPIEEREHIWAALALLTESPNPTPEEDAEYGGSVGPLDRSLNVVRGQAMRAVLGYLGWVRRLTDGEIEESELGEVAALLGRHLDPDHDPSTAIRSVYGEHFWYLLEALPEWTSRNVLHIFSEGAPSETALGDAAWSSYLARHNPNRRLFELLAGQYQRRVERLAGVSTEDINRARDVESGAARLAEHILLLYVQGTVTLDSEDRLLHALFEGAPATVLGEALGHLFWRLFRTEGPLDNELLDRVMRLWEWRAAEVAAGHGDLAELRGFGWLVRTGRFPVDWTLANLVEVTRTLGSVEMPEQIGEEIAPYARSHTSLVLAALQGLVSNQEGAWVAHLLAKHAVPAIAVALQSSDDALQRAGSTLMNAFAEAGISDIRAQVDEFNLAE
ncbi:MAG: hypothetical protein ACYDGN_03320 [Acidimicrobiales bacterium]